jgi:serine/threonine protein kinase/Tfp pilus assembly protein PilF
MSAPDDRLTTERGRLARPPKRTGGAAFPHASAGETPALAAGGPAPPAENPDLIRAVEEYAAALEAGGRPDRQAFLARHPALSAELAECLDGLEFVAAAASELGPEAPGGGRAAAEEPPPPFPLEGYRIVRELGRGGMGIVYEAVEVALGRRVALKLLPSAAALDFRQLQRFKHEARAAALLHHESIVPVYAVGSERGVHYYAMQYIEGVNLAAVVGRLRQRSGLFMVDGPDRPADSPSDAAAALSTQHDSDRPAYFRSVARLGVQAAEALEHAHQMGVVHRDVKPANLLIDARARLWITDFGLALCQGEGGLTRTGDLVGTLRYVSPEQALGRRGLVDHRTDVYGLGVTLYELLTLEPAYPGGDRQELLRQIAFEEPRPARRLNPALPVELDTILLKAMAKEPTARYATAQELADDLRCFLDDRPIRARRPTLFDRATKWGRRHKAAVGAVAALVAVALVALGVSTVLIWGEQQNTKREQMLTNSALGAARLEKSKAEAALAEARAVVDDTYTEVANWLEDEPLSEQLQRKFFHKALEYFQHFASEDGGDPKVQQQTAQAGRRLGDIQLRLGEYEEARKTYAEAVGRFEQLVAAFPDSAEYRQDFAGCLNSLGVFFVSTGHPREAAKKFRQAVGSFEQPGGGVPPVAGARDGLATAYTNLAALLTEIDGESGWREAEAFGRKALALREQIAGEAPADKPDSLRNRHGLAQVHDGLGVLYWEAGQLARAEENWRKAMEIVQPLVQQHPRRTEFVETLALCLGHMGALLVAADRAQEAEPVLRQARALGQRLAADFPKKHAYRRKLAVDCSTLSVLLERTGRLREAKQVSQQAVDLGASLVANNPREVSLRRELAGMFVNFGNVLKDLGGLHEAEDKYGRAADLVEEQASRQDGSPQARATLGDCRNNLGSIYWTTGRIPEAESSYRKAIDVRARLVEDFPSVPTYRVYLANSCINLGRMLQSTGRSEEAEPLFRRALGLWADPTEDASQASTLLARRVEARGRLGQLLWQVERTREARAELAKAGQEWGRLLKEFPDHPGALNGLAWFLATCPDPDLRNPSRAVELATKAVSRAPKVGAYWNTLGTAHYRAGDHAAALAAMEQAVRLHPQGDACDSILLALVYGRLGREPEADCWYERATEQFGQDFISAAESAKFRKEAAALLGKPDPQPH